MHDSLKQHFAQLTQNSTTTTKTRLQHCDAQIWGQEGCSCQKHQALAVGSGASFGLGGKRYMLTSHHTRNASSIHGTGKPLQADTTDRQTQTPKFLRGNRQVGQPCSHQQAGQQGKCMGTQLRMCCRSGLAAPSAVPQMPASLPACCCR